jgi:hypothetical protein
MKKAVITPTPRAFTHALGRGDTITDSSASRLYTPPFLPGVPPMLAGVIIASAYSPSAGTMRLPWQAPRDFVGSRHATISVRMLAPVDYKMVAVEEDADAVAAIVRYQVEAAAEASIAKRGHFALAIPGGSVMKMLAESGAPAWARGASAQAYRRRQTPPSSSASCAGPQQALLLQARAATASTAAQGHRGAPVTPNRTPSIEQAHQPDEYVSLEQLARCQTFLRGLACSREIG